MLSFGIFPRVELTTRAGCQSRVGLDHRFGQRRSGAW